MAEENAIQGTLFTEAEVLRDDFLAANEGNVEHALLAACQQLLKLTNDLEQSRHSTSVGYLRASRDILR